MVGETFETESKNQDLTKSIQWREWIKRSSYLMALLHWALTIAWKRDSSSSHGRTKFCHRNPNRSWSSPHIGTQKFQPSTPFSAIPQSTTSMASLIPCTRSLSLSLPFFFSYKKPNFCLTQILDIIQWQINTSIFNLCGQF